MEQDEDYTSKVEEKFNKNDEDWKIINARIHSITKLFLNEGALNDLGTGNTITALLTYNSAQIDYFMKYLSKASGTTSSRSLNTEPVNVGASNNAPFNPGPFNASPFNSRPPSNEQCNTGFGSFSDYLATQKRESGRDIYLKDLLENSEPLDEKEVAVLEGHLNTIRAQDMTLRARSAKIGQLKKTIKELERELVEIRDFA